METQFRYNVDNTIELLPIPVLKRWEKYRQLKEDLNEKRYQLQCAEKNSEFENIKTLDNKIEQIKKKIDIILPKYERKNHHKNGYTLNKNAKKRIRLLLHLYFRNCKKSGKYLEFVTLTIPDNNNYYKRVDDYQVSQQFKKFIEILRKSGYLRNYIYVAERQKNGKIHYHCIFHWNKIIRVFNLNLLWLYYLSQIGYPTTTKEKLIQWIKYNKLDLKNKFIRKQVGKALLNRNIFELIPVFPLNIKYENFVSPNSGKLIKNPLGKYLYNPVDVKKIYNVKSLSKYITKYVTKNNQKMYCRVWSATKTLLKKVVQYTGEKVRQILNQLTEKQIYNTFKKSIKIGEQEFLYQKYYITYETEYENKLIREIQAYFQYHFLST